MSKKDLRDMLSARKKARAVQADDEGNLQITVRSDRNKGSRSGDDANRAPRSGNRGKDETRGGPRDDYVWGKGGDRASPPNRGRSPGDNNRGKGRDRGLDRDKEDSKGGRGRDANRNERSPRKGMHADSEPNPRRRSRSPPRKRNRSPNKSRDRSRSRDQKRDDGDDEGRATEDTEAAEEHSGSKFSSGTSRGGNEEPGKDIDELDEYDMQIKEEAEKDMKRSLKLNNAKAGKDLSWQQKFQPKAKSTSRYGNNLGP